MSLRVLLTDEKSDRREWFKQELLAHFAGAEVDATSDIDDVAEMLSDDSYDVLVASPSRDGEATYEFVRMARAQAPECPIVIAASEPAEEALVLAMKGGRICLRLASTAPQRAIDRVGASCAPTGRGERAQESPVGAAPAAAQSALNRRISCWHRWRCIGIESGPGRVGLP